MDNRYDNETSRLCQLHRHPGPPGFDAAARKMLLRETGKSLIQPRMKRPGVPASRKDCASPPIMRKSPPTCGRSVARP